MTQPHSRPSSQTSSNTSYDITCSVCQAREPSRGLVLTYVQTRDRRERDGKASDTQHCVRHDAIREQADLEYRRTQGARGESSQ